MKKIVTTIMLVLMLTVLPLTAAFAQGATPAAPPTFDLTTLVALIFALVVLVVLVYAVALVVERSTEVTKYVSSWVAKFPALSKVNITGAGSFILSLIYSVAIVFNFHVNLLSTLPIFSGLDPTLVQSLTAVIVWIVSNILHDSGQLPSPSGSSG